MIHLRPLNLQLRDLCWILCLLSWDDCTKSRYFMAWLYKSLDASLRHWTACKRSRAPSSLSYCWLTGTVHGTIPAWVHVSSLFYLDVGVIHMLCVMGSILYMTRERYSSGAAAVGFALVQSLNFYLFRSPDFRSPQTNFSLPQERYYLHCIELKVELT